MPLTAAPAQKPRQGTEHGGRSRGRRGPCCRGQAGARVQRLTPSPPPSALALAPQRTRHPQPGSGVVASCVHQDGKECVQQRNSSKKTNKSKFNPTYPRFPGERGRVLVLPSYVLKQKFKKKSEIRTRTPFTNIPQGHRGAQIHREPQFPPPRKPGLCCSQGGLSPSVWEATWGLGDRKLGRKGGRPERTTPRAPMGRRLSPLSLSFPICQRRPILPSQGCREAQTMPGRGCRPRQEV